MTLRLVQVYRDLRAFKQALDGEDRVFMLLFWLIARDIKAELAGPVVKSFVVGAQELTAEVIEILSALENMEFGVSQFFKSLVSHLHAQALCRSPFLILRQGLGAHYCCALSDLKRIQLIHSFRSDFVVPLLRCLLLLIAISYRLLAVGHFLEQVFVVVLYLYLSRVLTSAGF